MQTVTARFIFITMFLCFSLPSLAQKKVKDIKDYIPTENVDMKKDFNKRRNAPKRKNIGLIIKNDAKGILYGNPCMIEQTRRMGFEYAVQTKGLPGSLGFVKRNWNNLLVKLKLTFTRSPFWKLILRSRVKDCRQKTGDLVG